MRSRGQVAAAVGTALALPLGEVLWTRQHAAPLSAELSDELAVAAVLLVGAGAAARGGAGGRRVLALAWGVVLGRAAARWASSGGASGVGLAFDAALTGVALVAGWRALVARDPWVEPRVAAAAEPGVIAVDGHLVRGQAFGEVCGVCGGDAAYLEEFDASACPRCDRWVHGTCGGSPDCPFCGARPASPMAWVRAADARGRAPAVP